MGEETLKQKTAKGLFWGGLNNGIQLLLNLAFGIFLARILNKSDYGMVGMLTVFTLLASVLQDSGFGMALINRRHIEHKDYNAVFWFSTFMGLGLYVLLFFCAPLIADFYRTPSLVPLARVVFLGFVISSTGIAHGAMLTKKLLVKQRSLCQLIALLFSGIVGITVALSGGGYWGLVAQNISYILVSTIGFWVSSKWRPTFSWDFQPLKEMLGFSSKLLVTNLFLQFNNNLLQVLLGRFFTTKDVGVYSQATKWNTMGVNMIAAMVQGVAQPVLKEVDKDSARQLRVFRKMLRFVSFVSFPLLFGLSVTAHEVIVLLLTDKWASSALLLNRLAIMGAFIPIINLYTYLLISRGRSGIYMGCTIALGIVQIISMLLVYPYGISTMVTVYCTIHILWLLVWHVFVQRQIALSFWMMIQDIAPFAGLALVSVGSGVLMSIWLTPYVHFMPLVVSLAIKVLVAATLYIGVLYLLKVRVLMESLSHLLGKQTKNER